MRRFMRTLLCVLLLPAQALAYMPDAAMLKDYAGLTKALKANGIDPAFVNWRYIEPMCLGLKGERDQVNYNRCRFEKAGDWAAYNDNSRDCARAGFNEYPTYERVVQASVTGGGNSANVLSAEGTYLTREQVRRQRHASYIACMRDFGWRNPSNWLHGRSYGLASQ